MTPDPWARHGWELLLPALGSLEVLRPLIPGHLESPRPGGAGSCCRLWQWSRRPTAALPVSHLEVELKRLSQGEWNPL